MRTLADIFGMLVFVLGILLFMLSCLGPPHIGNSMFFWSGLILMAGGWVICHGANRKTCPQCAERVKVAAIKCKHCGHEFGPPPRSPASEPFYK